MEDTQEQAPPDSTTSTSSEAIASEASTTAVSPGTSNVTPTSSTSNISRPSGLPKPSGIKPPSKIGRLCANSTPKPAVPLSPRTDGSSTDTLRKLSSEYSRKQLSDLVEAEEDGEPSSLPSESYHPHRKASTSSTYSVTSMDALWEKHPRRLSEAGLRRSSDHSVVLTEDTDSFIIGDRVWVGGTKPGQIAYIGETQFAPGEWAGIVLDDAIGKNDGSVAGVRYFQCSEKRGVFSRLTRLTRSPIIRHDASPVSDAGSVFERPPSGTPRRRTLSPNGSIKSAVSSKMNASISTSTGPALQLGERVIVSSSRGSKLGALRFVGPTDFASGLWAGVELDDPIGKNDGSVEGKRYFECSPRFGLFAPISKVSRSPSSRKPGACAIHNNGRATPLRRSNSRDSFTSLGTSIASSRVPRLASQRVSPRVSATPISAKNALQELLREKQQHIERLIKEREVERADVVKATVQAERAEAALVQLKKDAALGTSENEKFKMELEKLNKLLEDERQKVEDLMFRNEEENINKEDYNKYREQMEQEKSSMEQRIRELEAEVSLQCSRAEASTASARALDQQRLADATTLAEQHKEELASAQTLSTELQKLLDEAYALLQEKESEKESLSKSMSDELSKYKMESEKSLNETKSKMAIAQSEYETQVSVLTAKLQLTESKLEAEKLNIDRLSKDSSQVNIDLNAKLSQLQAALDDKTHELNKVLGISKEHELNLNKEITKLKMELSVKLIDYEQMLDLNKKQETTCKSLENEISRVNKEFAAKINEYEGLLNEITQQNDSTKNEVLLLQQNLSAKTKEYEKLIAESNVSNDNSEKLIHEYKQKIHERDKEIIKLKDDYEQANASFNIKHSKIAEEYKKEIDNRNMKIEELLKELEGHKQLVESNKVEFENLNSQFNINNDEIKLLKEQNEELKKSVTELSETNIKLKNKISEMELEKGEFKRQLASSSERCAELLKMKEKIENEYLNLTGQATDSNEQFNQLTQHLKETEKELMELKDKFREAANNYHRNEQESKQQNDKIQEQFRNECRELSQKLNISTETHKLQESKLGEYETQINSLKDKLKESEISRDKSKDDNLRLNNDIENLKQKEIELTKEYQDLLKNMEDNVQKYKEEITKLKAVGESSEVTLKEKVDQLIEAQNELNNKLEEAQKHEDALQKIVDDMTLQLNTQKNNYEQEIVSKQETLSVAQEEINVVKLEETKLKEMLLEKENSVKELLLKIGMYEVDIKSNADIISEKERQITSINAELSKIVENKKSVDEKFSESIRELSELKQKYESMLSNSSAEESLLKGQQQQLEILQKDLVSLKHEKQAADDAYKNTCNELNKLKSDYSITQNELQENIKIISNLKSVIAEKEVILKEHSDKHLVELDRVRILENELSQLSQELSTKNNIVKEKEKELSRINELTHSTSSESQLQIKSLQEKNIELSNKHDSELKTLNKTINNLQVQVTQQQNTLEELCQSKTKITELQSLLQKSENDIKVLTNVNEGQKSNYDDLMKQLQSQYDDLKKDSKRLKSELKQRLTDSEKELRDAKTKMESEITKQELLKKSLETSEANVVELSNQLELLTMQQNSNVERDGKLEKLTLELQASRKSGADAVTKNDTLIKELNMEINNKTKDLKDKDHVIVKLQEDLKNQIVKTEICEREKCTLQKELASRPKDIFKDSNDNGLATNSQQEEVEGQVSFLNSVIVDMQRKNERLTARVQALEAGTDSSPEISNGKRTPRAVAPRLFCDICDVFDAHDTEDCPRQSAAPSPPPQNRARPPPRSYCDICEVFGHATENCDEEETF